MKLHLSRTDPTYTYASSVSPGALIVFAGLIAYWNSFRTPFVFDGIDWVVNNPTIRQLWPLGPVLLPALPGSTVEGRPLLNLSFALNFAFGGVNPWGYHVVNFAVHMLAGLTLFGIVRRTFISGADRTKSNGPGFCRSTHLADSSTADRVGHQHRAACGIVGWFPLPADVVSSG